jgi:hypothetical protein
MGMPLSPPMFAAPTVSLSGTLPIYDGGSTSTVNSVTSYATADTLEVDLGGASGITAYRPAIIYKSGSGGYLLLVADL